MAQAPISEEAVKRLADAETVLHEKWGRTSGILIAAYAAALFIDAAVDPAYKADQLVHIIEGVFQRIVAKAHPDGKEAVLTDLDEMLVKIFSENYPGQTFKATHDADGVDVTMGDGEDLPPPGTLLN